MDRFIEGEREELLTAVLVGPLLPHRGTFHSPIFQSLGTGVIFLTNTTVLSPVAARKAVNFKNKSRSGDGAVVFSTGRPPASTSSTEQGSVSVPWLGESSP